MKNADVTFDPFRDGELSISVPTTESQKEIWSSIEIDQSANLCYNESIRIELKGVLKPDILELAINKVIERHDALRATFSPRGKDFLVSIHQHRKMPFEDFSAFESQVILQKINEKITQVTLIQFNLLNGPLFKFELIKIAQDHHLLFLTAHHLVCDGWSIAVIVNEISVIYEQLNSQINIELPAAKQLADYIIEHKNQSIDTYWLKEFKTIPKPLDLPSDLKRPEFRRYESQRIDFKIDPEIVRTTQKMAAKNRKSYYQYLFSAFQTLVYHLSKNDDFVIGISSAAQSAAGLNNLVGHLVNLLPIRTNIEKEMTFSQLLNQTKTKMLDAFDHQNSTFGQILNNLKIERDPSRIPLVNIIFNVDQQYPGQGLEFKNISAHYESNPRHFENFEIFINATTLADSCIIECQYNIHLFKEETILNWLKNFEKILTFYNTNVDAKLDSFDITELIIPKKSSNITKIEKSEFVELSVNHENIKLMQNLWEQALGITGISETSNFFSLGGHSLLGVDICHQIQEKYGVKLTLKDLIKKPILRDFASLLPINKNESTVLISSAKNQKVENTLSVNQVQTWFLEQMNPGTSMHNLPSTIITKTKVDIDRLTNAYLALLENHPALRTTFHAGPIQKIASMDEVRKNFKIESKKMPKAEVIKQMNELGSKAYDLTTPPLLKVILYETTEGEYVIFSRFHHIVFDGWCFDIFLQEITDLYEGKSVKNEDLTYFDYVDWQNQYLVSDQYKSDLSFWTNKLSGELPVLDFPTDFTRPVQMSHAGGICPFEFDAILTDKIKHYCELKSISPFTLFLACFKKTLMDFAQSDEIIVGIPVRGRNTNALLNTIGYFVNALPIRTNKESHMDQFFKHVQDEVGDALAYQDVPFSKIIQALGVKRDPGRTSVFQSFFSYQSVENRKGLFNGEPYSQVVVKKASTHTDIDLWMKTTHSKTQGAFEYRLDLFQHVTIDRLKNYFVDLITFIIEDKTNFFNDFRSDSVINEYVKINQNYTSSLPTKTIVEYVDEFAAKTPNQIAIVAGDQKYSYKELALKTDALASELQAFGIKKGDLIGVCTNRDANMLIGLLAIMKAGAGYVPLDPYFPMDRLDYMIEHSKLKTLICHDEYSTKFDHHSLKVFTFDKIDWNSKLSTKVKVDQEQTIYVIYTSGSTGKPKGVNLSYRSVNNFLVSMQKEPGFTSNNKLLAVTTLSFDIAVLELYLPLISGGTVVIAAKEDTIDGDSLKELIERENIDVMQATPSTWRLLLAAGWRGSKSFKVLCGGEPFPKDLAQKLIDQTFEVWNMYGPTETTVWSTCKKITNTKGPILIGKPIDNTSVYILDENKKPIPYGSVGELYIGGEGLALGYIHRPDLTEERFVFDSIRQKGMMYQTGDLARFHFNGELECLGRNDGQVKVRGYRIELGEIESVLSKQDNILNNVVMVREDRPGDVRIVAYLILKNKSFFDQTKLREFLGKSLPPYMIPTNYVVMDSFPLTLNNKIDKKLLPSLQLQTNNVEEVQPSSDKIIIPSENREIEIRLAKIWKKVLGVNNYELNDNFFEVGGHSLLSVDLFGQIAKEFGVEISLASLVTHQTFAQILELIEPRNIGSKLTSDNKSHGNSINVPALCSSLVLIKNSGDKNPIFAFHGVGGNILNYMKLAPACGNHPLIGVQSQGVDGKSIPLSSIEQMAQKYIDEIRLIQPQGPYIFVGGSMGGLIALEAARLIQELKLGDVKVVMFDTFGPDVDIKKYTKHTDSWLKGKLFSIKWRLKKILVRLRSSFLTFLGLPIPHEIRYFNIEVLNYQALWKYKTKEYHGDIHIIRAPIVETGWYSDPKMGWSKVIKGEVYTNIITGSHEDFVESKELPEAFKNVLSS